MGHSRIIFFKVKWILKLTKPIFNLKLLTEDIMLGDFFRINMPYGIRRNESGEWHAFNREYMPLGFNDQDYKDKYQQMNLPIYTKYKGMTEKKLLAIAWNDPDGIRRDEAGEINMVFLYNDGINPMKDPKYWNDYFNKIKLLSNFKELQPIY